MESGLKFPFKVLDLTYPLNPEVPSWNGSCGFSHSLKLDYQDGEGEVKFRVQQMKMHAGIGTHMDAPSHVIPGGKNISELLLEQLIAPAYVIDVSKKAGERYSLTPADIKNFENEFGKIQEGAFVIVETGWSRFWKDPKAYRNEHVFPSIGKEAAEIFLERKVGGLGIDTLSPDRPEDGFYVHQLILWAGGYIVENVAEADKLPRKGAFTFAIPIKVEGVTEAPIRLFSLVNRS